MCLLSVAQFSAPPIYSIGNTIDILVYRSSSELVLAAPRITKPHQQKRLFLTKNCFYSDTENKACADSFVLYIAVKTNVSEGFVFTAIWSTNQIS